jgi:chemotaxis family two-component system response regulator Rcp1
MRAAQQEAARREAVLGDPSDIKPHNGDPPGSADSLLTDVPNTQIPGARRMPAEQQRMHPVYGQPIEILLVEDNPDDASLTVETLQEGRIRNNVAMVEDGVAAMKFLRRDGEYAGAPRPDLILLDLQLPRKNGREVLAEIKQDPELKTIPVVILTTSSAEKDVFETYALHANCYVTKPVDLDEFIGAVRQIEDFWLTIVKLPRAAA